MDGLTFEDKSGQQGLYNKLFTNSDSEDVSDSDQEGKWVNLVKQGSSSSSKKLSSCWNDMDAVADKQRPKLRQVVSKKQDDEIDLDDVYLDLDKKKTEINHSVRKTANQDELMKGTVIGPEFHRLHEVPTTALEVENAKERKKKEKAKSAGSKWFNMPAPEMTDELRRDLEVIQMRSVMDPKQFYKKHTASSEMKYFQVGRIVESSADFYHSRVPKKDRKKTLVDELLANTEFKKYNRKRYKEIITKTRPTDARARRHAKRLKK